MTGATGARVGSSASTIPGEPDDWDAAADMGGIGEPADHGAVSPGPGIRGGAGGGTDGDIAWAASGIRSGGGEGGWAAASGGKAPSSPGPDVAGASGTVADGSTRGDTPFPGSGSAWVPSGLSSGTHGSSRGSDCTEG